MMFSEKWRMKIETTDEMKDDLGEEFKPYLVRQFLSSIAAEMERMMRFKEPVPLTIKQEDYRFERHLDVYTLEMGGYNFSCNIKPEVIYVRMKLVDHICDIGEANYFTGDVVSTNKRIQEGIKQAQLKPIIYNNSEELGHYCYKCNKLFIHKL